LSQCQFYFEKPIKKRDLNLKLIPANNYILPIDGANPHVITGQPFDYTVTTHQYNLFRGYFTAAPTTAATAGVLFTENSTREYE
jgi:hypothetical protein